MNATKIQKPAATAKKCSKPQRRIGWIYRQGPCTGVIQISIQRGSQWESNCYTVAPIPSDFGEGFSLGKLNTKGETVESYNVNLDREGDICDCLGFSSHSHCKHCEGLRALFSR